MRFFLFASFLSFLLYFSACQNGTEQQISDIATDVYSVSKSKVERDYFRYGEDVPFMNEYGEVVTSSKLDSTLLEYCKDSSVSFHKPSGKYIRSNSKICYPTKVVFVDNQMLVRTEVEPAGNFFSRSNIKGVYPFKIDDKPYTIFRLFSIVSEDQEGAKILMHSNEYWSEELGLILKMDENFMNKRRRIIRTNNVTSADGKLMDTSVFFDRIYQDSSDWITKNKDGTPWF